MSPSCPTKVTRTALSVTDIDQHVNKTLSTRARHAFGPRAVPLISSTIASTSKSGIRLHLASSSQSSSHPVYSCRVVTRSEYAHHAHGASRLAVRRPRRGGKARLLPQPALSLERPFRDMCDLQRTASSSGRVRDIADQRHYFRNGAHETLFLRLMMAECT